ncbi:MAG: hypothetical protein PHC46_00585 [Clostridia bacterium]|nr:hypothetical protein [Clostridia bacterium]
MKDRKIQPIIKNVYRKTIKAVKKTAKLILIAGLTFSASAAVISAGREIYEEKNTENLIVDLDFGLVSFVLKNKDSRSAIEIYQDVIKAGLNVEGLKEVYKNAGSMTIEQKKEFLSKFTKEISEAAGIRISKVVFENPKNYEFLGHYIGGNLGFIAFSKNEIHINEKILEYSNLIRSLEVCFHEVIHAVENINIQTNKNVDNLNTYLHNGALLYADHVYFSNFYEITTFLLTGKFKSQLKEKFSRHDLDYEYYETDIILSDWLSEVVKNDMQYHKQDENYYYNFTVKQIIDLGLKNNYEYRNIKFNEEILENSYTYDIINYALPSYFLDVNYKDFKLGYANFKSWNLQEETQALTEYIENCNASKYSSTSTEGISNYSNLSEDKDQNYSEHAIARQMAKIMAIVRYDADSYNGEDVKKSFDLVQDNLCLMEDSVVEFYRLDQIDDINIKQENSKETYIVFNLKEEELEC